jgi:hypothetical protein
MEAEMEKSGTGYTCGKCGAFVRFGEWHNRPGQPPCTPPAEAIEWDDVLEEGGASA